MIPRQFSRALVLALLSAGVLIGASALDLETPVAIDVLPGKVTWSVAGTTMSTTATVTDVTAFTITTHEGLFPTGVHSLKSRTGNGRVRHWPVVRRFLRTNNDHDAVGDWWVDATIPEIEVFSAEADLGADFSIAGSFTGRYHQHTTLRLEGSPGISCSFRRGLLNNDLHIFDHNGAVIVSGSLDPRPGDRLAAIAATVLRGIGGGCLLLALWSMFSSRSQPSAPFARPQRPGRLGFSVIVLSAAGAAAMSAWTAINVLEGLPHQPDEVVYLLQSEWILSGGLTGRTPDCCEHFEIPFTYFRGDRWVGHYPPAWPLILTPGVRLGIAWLVPSVLRFAFVILVGLFGCRVAGRWAGVGAALLASTSPIATLLFASTMPHAGSATLLLAGLALFFACERRASPLRLAFAGLFFGAAFAIRPLTSMAFAAPLGCVLLHAVAMGRRPVRDLVCLIVGSFGGFAPALAANTLLTGSPWKFPYSLAEAPMVSPDHLMFGIRNVDAILASLLPLLHGWGWPWLPENAALVLPLAFVAVPFLSGSATREEKILLAVSVSVISANVIARAHGLHGFGPRYAFAACAPLWVLTACGVVRLAKCEYRRPPAAGLVLVILIVSAALSTPSRMGRYRGYNDVDGACNAAIKDLPPWSIVLLPEDDWRGWAHATPWVDPNTDESPLFALDLGDNIGLEWCFPDRAHYRWNEGCLEPTATPRAPRLPRELSDPYPVSAP